MKKNILAILKRLLMSIYIIFVCSVIGLSAPISLFWYILTGRDLLNFILERANYYLNKLF